MPENEQIIIWPHIAIISRKIEQLDDREISKEAIKRIVHASSAISGAIADGLLTEKQRDAIVKGLERKCLVRQGPGHSVTRVNINPWLQENKSSIDFHYWQQWKTYISERNLLPHQVIETLDVVSDQILDYSGNPNEDGIKSRGLVLGQVQSGKTDNYSALICKAMDAGYKIIIVLTGISERLRQQTQQRIDNVTDDSHPGSSVIDGRNPLRKPVSATQIEKDFTSDVAQTFRRIPSVSISEPLLFVVKKNTHILQSVKDWIENERRTTGSPDYPLLLIDDEADNASINTNADQNRVTRINEGIREILQLFPRSSYIGYTATPFANIFIAPDTNDEMLQDDLFPRDFIKLLDPPSNYVSPNRVFGEYRNDLADTMIQLIDDYDNILPLKHKKEHSLTSLPQSLYEAIRVFILARAIRILDGYDDHHCSMMVNVSRFNNVQDKVSRLIDDYLDELKQAIGSEETPSDNHINNLCQDFGKKYAGHTSYQWPAIQRTLPKAVATVKVHTVNMRGGREKLDYAGSEPRGGLHVIAVGGLALSRGLTLEGLIVSYMLRNAGAYDTLMQMGRWFGYRPDYEKLCRLYINEESHDHYSYISRCLDELGSELRYMERRRLTPEDYGLKIRRHPLALTITARNKMRSARPIIMAADYAKKHIEGYAIYNDDTINNRNRGIISDFLLNLGEPSPLDGSQKAEISWKKIPVAKIKSCLERLTIPTREFISGSGKSSLAQDYINDRLQELSTWDVIAPQVIQQRESTPDDSEILLGKTMRCRTRTKGTLENDVLMVTGKKQRLADREDVKFGMTPEQWEKAEKPSDQSYNQYRERPLLIIHVFKASLKNENPLSFTKNCVSISICFPKSCTPPFEREYAANTVLVKQLERESQETETDEDTDDIDSDEQPNDAGDHTPPS